MDNRAVTKCGTDYMYLTEEGKEDGTARKKHDVGATEHRGRGQEDRRNTRTQSAMQRQWRPLDCDKDCSGQRSAGI